MNIYIHPIYPNIFISLALLFSSSSVLADPPYQVLRLSETYGDVSFSPLGDEAWVKAVRNRPLVEGDELWSASGSKVQLHMDGAVACVDEQTHLELLSLTDELIQLSVYQGAFNLYVHEIGQDQSYEIDTPNLALTVSEPGYYQVGVTEDDTLVSVSSGSADVYGTQNAYRINEGSSFKFAGDVLDYTPAPFPLRAFNDWCLTSAKTIETAQSKSHVPKGVIGYQDLDRYGQWTHHHEYGHVWSPTHTRADWAPYRHGHWSWIEPWGWTWVDDEPWGFAPYHYGRWSFWDDRWYWVPGSSNVRAVYAPALTFFIGSESFSFSLSLGSDVRPVAWFPLGPRDYYSPSYYVSYPYFNSLNRGLINYNKVTVNNYYNNPTYITQNTFVNRDLANAITAVPASAFTQSKSVADHKLTIKEMNKLGKIQPAAPVAPELQSVLGASEKAKAKPKASNNRKFVAKHDVTPKATDFEDRKAILDKQPGKPLDPDQASRINNNEKPTFTRATTKAPKELKRDTKPIKNNDGASPKSKVPESSINRERPKTIEAPKHQDSRIKNQPDKKPEPGALDSNKRESKPVPAPNIENNLPNSTAAPSQQQEPRVERKFQRENKAPDKRPAEIKRPSVHDSKPSEPGARPQPKPEPKIERKFQRENKTPNKPVEIQRPEILNSNPPGPQVTPQPQPEPRLNVKPEAGPKPNPQPGPDVRKQRSLAPNKPDDVQPNLPSSSQPSPLDKSKLENLKEKMNKNRPQE